MNELDPLRVPTEGVYQLLIRVDRSGPVIVGRLGQIDGAKAGTFGLFLGDRRCSSGGVKRA